MSFLGAPSSVLCEESGSGDQEVRQVASARELNDRYTAAINAHDPEAIWKLFSLDGLLQEPGGTCEGRESVIEYWQRFF